MSRSASEIKAAVFTALRRIAPDAEPANLHPTEKLREALDIDSYDFLQFLISLKKDLGVDVPEADYGKLQTLAEVLSYLQARSG
jgi:acyl carrier protein